MRAVVAEWREKIERDSRWLNALPRKVAAALNLAGADQILARDGVGKLEWQLQDVVWPIKCQLPLICGVKGDDVQPAE